MCTLLEEVSHFTARPIIICFMRHCTSLSCISLLLVNSTSTQHRRWKVLFCCHVIRINVCWKRCRTCGLTLLLKVSSALLQRVCIVSPVLSDSVDRSWARILPYSKFTPTIYCNVLTKEMSSVSFFFKSVDWQWICEHNNVTWSKFTFHFLHCWC